MDPQSTNQGSFEVPQVSPNSDMIPAVASSETLPTPELAPSQAAVPSAATSSQPAVDPAAMANIFQQSSVPPAPVATPSSPAVADDLDLIEKEWVDKAKAIVAQTKHDPFVQNKEISKFKADYIQKRYGKEIKLDEK